LTPAEVSALEPEVSSVAALLSPSSGIVDAHALMLSLVGEIENAGGTVALRTGASSVRRRGGRHAVITEDVELESDLVVIAAGLHSHDLAARVEGFPDALVPPAYLCKGNYFVLGGPRPFSRLIYPVPDQHSLGIHATLDLQGAVRFGPDVEWVDREDYDVDPHRSGRFCRAIRRYYPAIQETALSPGYAGIRPKIVGPGGTAQDFRIIGAAEHGISGLVALFGIESPGLTACLSIGEYTAGLLLG
jgi:L-2-hydroxyglutarate oxidase LhgO